MAQLMAWHRPGDKAINWTNKGEITDAYLRHSP